MMSACGKEPVKVDMNQLAEDNLYHYVNKDLGFKIDLPADFIYYQTQRRNIGDKIVLEIFVPTSDNQIPQELPDYGKPITVTLFPISYWDGLADDEDEKMFFTELGRTDEYVYGMRFWSRVPSDWNHIWNEEYAKNLELAFSLFN